jgi:hypothetical protein
LLDFAAHAGDLLFDFEDVADFSGSLREDGFEALFGFAGILRRARRSARCWVTSSP